MLKVATAVSAGAALGFSLPNTARADERPDRTLVGAIRWDAWVGAESHYGSGVNRALSPEKYHFRLPYYADITIPRPVLLDDGFDGGRTGAAPSGWSVTAPAATTVAVVPRADGGGKCVQLHDTSGSDLAAVVHRFTPQNRAVTFEWEWKETVAGNWARALLIDGSTAAVDIVTRVNAGNKELAYRAPDGTWHTIQAVADDTWYAMKVIADPAPPEGVAAYVDIFVDGARRVNHAPLLVPTGATFDSLALRTNETLTTDLFIDNVSVRVTESVNADGASQEVMDQEIAYARKAGIDYWAFVYYPQEPLARARELYLASAHRNDISWCAILDGNFTGAYTTYLPQLVARFGEPNYQRVLGGRPLVYFMSTATATWVTQMRTACSQAGLPDPYIVAMGWTADSVAAVKAASGADAVSRYATGEQNGAPYAELADAEAGLWDDYAAAAGEVIPTVSTGWDKRTRYENPASFDGDVTGFDIEWTQQATPQQIASHLRKAVIWNHAHPVGGSANAVLVYAWNEFDEGGWICPTLFELRDSGRPLRLDAIARVPRTAGGRG